MSRSPGGNTQPIEVYTDKELAQRRVGYFMANVFDGMNAFAYFLYTTETPCS
jgi:hypothetical protein